MSLRTPLGKVRGLGAAKSGTEHFWHQRLTAIANVPLVLFLVCFAITNAGASHAALVENIKHPAVGLLLVASVISMVWHMQLGLQVVIEDYIHTERAKFICLMGNIFFSALVGLTAIYAIARISFGA